MTIVRRRPKVTGLTSWVRSERKAIEQPGFTLHRQGAFLPLGALQQAVESQLTPTVAVLGGLLGFAVQEENQGDTAGLDIVIGVGVRIAVIVGPEKRSRIVGQKLGNLTARQRRAEVLSDLWPEAL